jgi:four helix bundle protein
MRFVWMYILDVYKATEAFPREEKFGLVSQLRRCAVSVPSNIAEGYGRRTTADYIRMLYIAYGSICELETQIMLSNDLEFLARQKFDCLQSDISDVERMLKALINSLKKKSLNP